MDRIEDMTDRYNRPLEVYTIGHSNHSVNRFVELLHETGITAIADVRSTPYSGRFPHFNQPELKQALSDGGIAYVFLGEALGARTKDRSCYQEGRADYELIASTEAFERGLDRVEVGARKYRIALMCAEREPLDCHRTILVSRWLQARGMSVLHVLADGSIEPNEFTEKRLLKMMKMETGDLFDTPESHADPLTEAYKKRGREIAYIEEQSETEDLATETSAA